MVETRLLPYFLTVARERNSTNAALMVQSWLSCALTIEGRCRFWSSLRLAMVPPYPELSATSVLVWKRRPPCGVDYFDFYLMHAQSADIFAKFKRCRAYETALELKAEGKIRHLGISFHDKAELRAVL